MTDVKPSSNLPLITTVIVIMIAIIAILISGLAWYEVNRLRDDNSRAKETLALLKTEMMNQQQAIEDTQKKLGRILKVAENNHQLHTLAQVSYLLQLANLHLNLSHDSDTAIKLMKMAQSLLNNLPSPTLLTLKKTISNDINALENAPRINVTALVLSLHTLDSKIQALTIIPKNPIPSKLKAEPVNSSNEESRWYNKILQLLSGFKDLISISHVQEPVTPLLSSKQTRYLKENIQIKINQAEWAILHNNETLYQINLADILKWLRQYFSGRDDVKPILKSIEDLSKININPKLPNISNSLNAIDHNTLIEKIVPRPLEKTPAGAKI